MELHNNRIENDAARRLNAEGAKSDLEATIDRVSDARVARQEQVDNLTERTRAHRERVSDSLDLSASARLFGDDSVDSDRAELVDGLRAAYESGNLNTRSRIERAAQNLLAGE
jgi:anti-sigma28 factor (negative regulator of flagellin synthesis)